MQWSVGMEATGDTVMKREQIVELADRVAKHGGIASGIGDTSYGAKILVEAPSREEAVDKARECFREAAESADLPLWPVTRIEAANEYEITPEDW